MRSEPGSTGRRKYKLKKAQLRLYEHIRCRINDVHRKLAKFLVVNYNVIFLPSFGTKQMLVPGKRVLNAKAARCMLTWSHYRFKQHLLYKASQSTHCKVVVCSEAYTSKTCGKCGTITKVGGSERYKCSDPNCNFKLDHDYNGARNIYLRNINSISI